MKTVLTADLGGTKCRYALLAADLGLHSVQQTATQRAREPFLESMVLGLQQAGADLPTGLLAPTAVGIGTAGVVAKDGRRIVYAPNVPLADFALAPFLEQRLGLPTVLLNDGRASALGEALKGHGQGLDPLLVLFFGTGIGIGLIVDGRPYEGARNAAGEIGHAIHLPGGRPCPCGQRGCYEAYCGGRPMCERAAKELGAPASGRRQWTVGEIVQVAEQAAESDERARQILEDAATAAGSMVAMACTLLNPAAVVLGGGVLQGWPGLRQEIESRVRSHCKPIVHEELQFLRSRGESDAILWGAAAATGQLW